MGCESMVTVQAEVGEPRRIYEAANELSKRAQKEHEKDPCPEVLSFFRSILSEQAFFSGNKGGDVLLWGGVWNYFMPDDFVDWIARLATMTPREWYSNIHLTWEVEQSEKTRLKVVWPERFRKYAVLVADVPDDMRWHWGICGDPGVPGRVLARIDGVSWSAYPMDTCQACRRTGVQFAWIPGKMAVRVCSNCSDKRRFVEEDVEGARRR